MFDIGLNLFYSCNCSTQVGLGVANNAMLTLFNKLHSHKYIHTDLQDKYIQRN